MSRAQVTPGVAYLARTFLSVVVPAASSVIVAVRLASLKGFRVSPWLISVIAIGAAPLGFVAYILADEVSQRRKASRLGARLVPRVKGKLPGNADKLVDMISRAESDYIGQVMLDETKEHGPTVNFRFLWEDIIMTTDPQHIKAILATDFNNYVKGPKFRGAADSVLGTGVFNSDDETWKLHRSMTRPFFTHDRISHFDIFERHADQTIALMNERFKVDLAIDFQDLISRFTLDSASEFLFGHCVNSLSVELPYPYNARKSTDVVRTDNATEAFSLAFSQAQQRINERLAIGQNWPLTEIFSDRTAQQMKVVDTFLDPILRDAVEKHRANAKLDTSEFVDDESLVDHLVKLTSDPKIIKDETLNILLAGRDTTASTLTMAIYLLAIHPGFLVRLREEIISRVGPTRRPTYDDIKEMKFLRAVLNETLRLFPAVPFDVREGIQDTTWVSPEPGKKPLFIPKGVTLTYSVLLMHRRTDLWGPDALEFDPDRWLDDRVQKYLVPNPFIFLPFNAGPRICLGQQFAYNEMSFMLVRLLQNFSAISLSPESHDPALRPPAWWAEKHSDGRRAIEKFWPRNHLTLYSKGGMWVKMEPVDSTIDV